MKKLAIFFLILSFLFTAHYFVFPALSFAHCPLCVAGAGAGLTLSRLLGIDDSVTGIWLGAFLGATAFWSERLIFKLFKISSVVAQNLARPVIYLSAVVLTLVSLYQFNLVDRMSQLFGLDKLTFGIIAGSVIFYLVDLIDGWVIQKNKKALFPYQRIAVGLGSILLASLADYYLINYVV